ncbi:MAG: DUF4292 domain-containing protein [Saprospiraceae bacterium]|nr:DUF4292 domain-containing protein [Saprospiraceae bacterium]
MNKIIRLHGYILFFGIILISLGCGSKKIVQQDGPVPDRNPSELFQALESHNYEFDWYACVTGIRVDNPDEGESGKAYIRMKKDSIIWSSVKKYSAEGVRVLITENTYASINRMDHTYQKGSTEDALSKMGVSMDFIDLQEAMFGNIMLLDTATAEINKEGNQYIIKGIDQDVQLKYWIDAYTLDLNRMILIDFRGREIDVSYGDYRTLDSGQKVPFFRHYKVPYDERGDAEIVMKVKKIEINTPKKTKFSIPPHYEKI